MQQARRATGDPHHHHRSNDGQGSVVWLSILNLARYLASDSVQTPGFPDVQSWCPLLRASTPESRTSCRTSKLPAKREKTQTRQRTSRQSHQSNNFELGGRGGRQQHRGATQTLQAKSEVKYLGREKDFGEAAPTRRRARRRSARSMWRSASSEPCASRPFSQAPDSERVQMKRAKSAWKPWKPYGNRPVNRQQSLETAGNRTFHGGVLRYHLLSLENARFPTVSNDSLRFPGRFASGFHGFQ